MSSVAWAVVLVVAAALVAAGIHWNVQRAFSYSHLITHNDVAGFLFSAICVIYAVVLGFVVIIVWEKYDTAVANTDAEVAAVADLYHSVAGYPPKERGQIRYIGFTGHKDPAIHLRMLDIAQAHRFRFDAVQMPLNVMDAHFRSFQQQVLPRLTKDRIGVLGMKPMGSGVILTSKVVEPVECLHYAMSLPTSTVITGINSMEVLRQDLDAVRQAHGSVPEIRRFGNFDD